MRQYDIFAFLRIKLRLNILAPIQIKQKRKLFAHVTMQLAADGYKKLKCSVKGHVDIRRPYIQK